MNSSDYLTKTDIMLMGGEPIDILMTANYAQVYSTCHVWFLSATG